MAESIELQADSLDAAVTSIMNACYFNFSGCHRSDEKDERLRKFIELKIRKLVAASESGHARRSRRLD